ncbi:MAG: multidrug effflux MFS transporter [Myxococcales bacterium]|nr:multidrug effflux MFS transporter [Myxococcales bacterium]MCB9716942.1 multidrug effflux MFS transporter [Myxococcales bacterium]
MTTPAHRLSTPELVGMVAALMSLNALAIDVMLPAMGVIAEDLGVADANDQQLVIVAYVIGFGLPQLVFGPLADRFGRRPTLAISLVGYTVAGFACMLAPSFELLLALRFVHGVFASGCRVIAVAVVRDLFAGRMMARLLSLVMTVFMLVPIIAPAIGQGIVLVASWPWCFGLLGVAGLVMMLWTAVRLPETLPEDGRRPFGLRATLGAYASVLRNRLTFGYMLGSGVVFGALFAFLSASEQIFREVFGRGDDFVLWFAGIAIVLAIANFANSRLVTRFGMRRLGHLALIAFTLLAATLYGLTEILGESFGLFYPLFTACFAFFGLIGANFNALAMEPLGRVAGTASAAYGFATTTLSALIGGLIGRAYDGTTGPLLLGFVVLGLGASLIVLVTERGRLLAGDAKA